VSTTLPLQVKPAAIAAAVAAAPAADAGGGNFPFYFSQFQGQPEDLNNFIIHIKKGGWS